MLQLNNYTLLAHIFNLGEGFFRSKNRIRTTENNILFQQQDKLVYSYTLFPIKSLPELMAGRAMVSHSC